MFIDTDYFYFLLPAFIAELRIVSSLEHFEIWTF